VANEPEQTQRNQGNIVRVIEVGVRLAIVVGLAVWCFEILRPFLSTIIWALIIAAALYPAYASLRRKLGMGPGATSLVFTAAVLVALMIPVIMLSGTLVESAREFAAELEDGTLQVPPPPEGVRSWPVLGGRIYDSWQLANENLEAALARFDDQLRTVGRWFISAAARAGLGILQFAVALVVAGIFLAYSESGGDFARNLGRRLAGPRGEGIADMASATVRSVAQGVLGVACIQAILAGVGFMLVDLPGAGLWTLIVLILATVQLPAGIVLIPSVFYVASQAGMVPTIVYGLWMVFVSLSDNVLKPLLLGRGGTAPAAVISLGAIGGLILQGIVGLFVGAVVLTLSYKLFMMWYRLDQPEELSPDIRNAVEARPDE